MSRGKPTPKAQPKFGALDWWTPEQLAAWNARRGHAHAGQDAEPAPREPVAIIPPASEEIWVTPRRKRINA
jgi:hypothetical protein